jgi:hypothetical protein
MRARNVLTMWSTLSVLSLSATAWGQVPYDPPTAVRPPPNVMVLMDATRTTLINGQTCTGVCHQEGNCGGGNHHDCGIYARGETRLQLARRVLTGGWGWNTNHVDGTNGVADARVRTDGVMDNYRVRWGVAWYDGLGTRIVVDPTLDSVAAQQAVIDFGLPSNESLGQGIDNGAGAVSLNSWLPYYRTTNCCSNASAAAADGASARMARALETIRQYWQPGVSAVRFPATTFTRNAGAQNGSVTWEQGPIDPGDETVIDLDPANVLVTSPANGGCRRNFTIMLTDGHGGGDWDPDGAGPLPAISRGAAAASIANMTGPGGVNLRTTLANRDYSNQLFVIHFGTQDKPNADTVADFGFDGIAGGTGLQTAFEGAPGGQITDLTPMLAAFSAVMGLVLDGTFTGAAPSVTRFGDYLVSSEFEIRSCAGLSPTQCNIGRPGTVRWRPIDQTGCDQTPKGANCGRLLNQTWDAGSILETRDQRTRRIFTGAPANLGAGADAVSDTNCGPFGSCATRTAAATNVPDLSWGRHHETCTHEVRPQDLSAQAVGYWGSALGLRWRDIAFLRGDPVSKFANGVFRGDWACNPLVGGTCCIDTNNDFIPDGFTEATARSAPCLDRPYKLADIANSKPVLVGAPAGIGEDITRWRHFLDVEIGRSGNALVPTPASAAANNGSGNPVRVGNRDEVIYLGGNDGMLHAFLSRRERPRTAANPGDPGRTIDYQPIGTACNTADRWCDGLELWAYAPRQLIPAWPLLQSGHFHMVDGTPVVADVLFTKGRATPNDPSAGLCNSHTGACNDWEYRTVLMQCLGAGGRGCFALDVTDPYAPELLWERTFNGAATQGALRGTSTSKPQIVKVKRVVTGPSGIPVSIPYYVAVMGGGMNEVNATTGNRQGTFMVVGLEDGRYWLSPAAQAASADFSGSPTCLDTDNDTFADTCYIATTDASMYKIRFTDGDPSQGITMRRFFNGRQAVNSVYRLSSLDLRTYHRVVATFDVSGSLNLFYGTGNFEAISDANEQNFFFKVVDNDPTAAPAAPANAGANLARTSGACDARLTGGGPNPTVANTGVLSLAAGEKIVFDPVIAAGSVFFTSYRPNTNTCLAGDGYLYGLNYANCRAGIDTNAATSGADTQRIGLTGPSNQGLPTAPIVNELSDTVYAQLSNGDIEDAAASTPPSVQVPLIKLWWREVTQ